MSMEKTNYDIFFYKNLIQPEDSTTKHIYGITSITISPNGKLLASSSYDCTVNLWNSQTGELIRTLVGHSDQVNSVAFDPDGNLLASGSDDRTVNLWNSQTGELIQTLNGHSDHINSVAFNPDGKLLASGSDDRTVNLWNSQTGELIQTLNGHSDQINSVALNPDGKLLASGSDDRTVNLWNSQTGELKQTLVGHRDHVNSVVFSPDGKFLASGSDDRTVNLWNSHTGELIFTLNKENMDHVNSVVFSPDGKLLASCSVDGTINLWDSQTRELIRTLVGHSNVNPLAFSSNEQYLFSISNSNIIQLWKIEIWGYIRTLKGHNDYVNSVAFSPDKKLLASGSDDCTVNLWDSQTGEIIKTLVGHRDHVNSVVFSPDGKLLASGSDDCTLNLWNSQTGELILTLNEKNMDHINSVAFCQDGKLLASGSDNCIINLWDSQTGELIQTLVGHRDHVNSVAFSPDENLLASGSDDCTVNLWDSQTGKLIRSFKGHSHVNSVEFSPDGKLLVSGSDDRIVNLWDSQTGELILTFDEKIMDHIRSVAFNLKLNEKNMDYIKSVAMCINEIIEIYRISEKTVRWIGFHSYEKILMFSPDSMIEKSSLMQDQIQSLFRMIDNEKISLLYDLFLTLPVNIKSIIDTIFLKVLMAHYFKNKEDIWNLNFLDILLDFIKSTLHSYSSYSPYYYLGQLAYMPILITTLNEDRMREYQKEFFLGLNSGGRNLFWATTFEKIRVIDKWTIHLYRVEDSEIPTRQLIDKNNTKFVIKDRNETNLRFQLVVHNLPHYLEPLIQSIIITIESNRGDIYKLEFTDFFYKRVPYLYKHEIVGSDIKLVPYSWKIEFQDEIIFKIDPGFSMEQYAYIKFDRVEIKYNQTLIQNISDIDILTYRISEIFNAKIKTLIEQLNLSTNFLPNDEKFEHNIKRGFESEIFDMIKEEWEEPNLPDIQIKMGKGIGAWFGKWSQAIQASLIVAGSLPGIIQFFLRLAINVEVLPMNWYIVSYIPIILILIIFTIKFVKNQFSHNKKKNLMVYYEVIDKNILSYLKNPKKFKFSFVRDFNKPKLSGREEK